MLVTNKIHSGQLFQKELAARYYFLSGWHLELLDNRSPPAEKGLLLGLVLNKKSKPRAEKQEKRAFSVEMAD